MGIEDLSLDDIIKKKNKQDMYSDNIQKPSAFQARKRPVRGGTAGRGRQMKSVQDARFLISNRSKTKITDARQKISSKQVIDAREKLRAKKNLTQRNGSQTGTIPKITISNDRISKKPYQRSDVLFHVTDGARSMNDGGISLRKHSGSKSSSLLAGRLGTGIQIAVKNDRASTRNPSSKSTHKTFERLQITTINRDVMRRKPQPPTRDPSPPRTSRPTGIRKRAMMDSDSEYEEFLKYRKQRRRQDIEDMETDQPPAQTRSKTDINDLRPMISRQTAPTKEVLPKEDEVLDGPSPIEGTKLKVFNLHPAVSEDDILELFSVIGAVRRARLVKPGEAEVVYIRHGNAMAAYKKYNLRDLDGQPMQIKIMKSTEERAPVMYSWMKDIKSSKKISEPGEVTELHSGVLQQALFKGGSTGTSTRPVVFTVKI